MTNSETNAEFPTWQQAYQEALIETDKTALRDRVLRVEEAIFSRLQ